MAVSYIASLTSYAAYDVRGRGLREAVAIVEALGAIGNDVEDDELIERVEELIERSQAWIAARRR